MKRVKLPGYKSCFGCGDRNPIGLRLERFWDGHKVYSEFVLGDLYQGFDGVAHGGIVATIADELMWWCIAAKERKCTVTAEIKVRFRKPVSVRSRYRAEALVDWVKGRKIKTLCRIEGKEGVVAEAEGLFVALSQEEWERFLEQLEDDSVFVERGQ